MVDAERIRLLFIFIIVLISNIEDLYCIKNIFEEMQI